MGLTLFYKGIYQGTTNSNLRYQSLITVDVNFVDGIYLATFGSIYEKINVGANLAHKKTNRYTYSIKSKFARIGVDPASWWA